MNPEVNRRSDAIWAVLISCPPSANGMYRAVGGRVLMSEKYRLWLNDCWAACLSAGVANLRLRGPLRVTVTIRGGKGMDAGCDLDNRAKPILDGLRKAQVIVDDTVKTVQELRLAYLFRERGESRTASCQVVIERIELSTNG